MEKFNLYLGNKETSAAIQKELFAMGYGWANSGMSFQDYSYSWISIRPDQSVLFNQCDGDAATRITLYDLFRTNEKLRIKPRVKEMTVSEISKELGYEVKIVK